MPNQIVTKLRQGPPPVWQAQLIWGNVRQPPHIGELRSGDPLGRSAPTQVLYRCHSGHAKGMEIGIDGIDMYIEHLGDFSSRQPGGIEQDGFGPATLRRQKRAFKHLVELSNVCRLRLTNDSGPGHSCTSHHASGATILTPQR